MKTNKIELKIISVCTLLLLSGFIIFAYTQYDDYRNMEQKFSNIQTSMEEELDIYIKSILTENQKKAELYIGFYTNLIHENLLKGYNNDLDELEQDILNPTEDSKLVQLIDKTLEEVYINNDTNHNKPFVASLNNIIWNRVLPYDYQTNTDKVISWEEFINKHYNSNLSQIAMESLKNMNSNKHDFIFWEAIENNNPEHTLIKDMDINDVLDVYKKEGIEGLKSYELLIPIYITKNGDIFGTKDVNTMGHKIENYKIIIIQRMNIYDALEPYLSSITVFENEISKIELESSNVMQMKAYGMIISTLLSIITLVGSAYLQKKFND